MHLSDLADATGLTLQGADVEVTGIALDSRHVQPGDLFVAVPGLEMDGAHFIADAARSGAVAVCAAEPADGLPTLVAEDPRRALARLAATLYDHPARELTLVGITGSLGKTSTTLMVEAILDAGGIPTGSIGSLGIRLRRQVLDASMTTPEAPSIHRSLRGMAAQKVRTAVMEVTSHALLLGRVAGLELDVGALTNIVPDEHLEFHPTPEHYIRTKAMLFDMLKPGAPLVYNLDDPIVRDMVAGLEAPLVAVSTEGAAEAAVTARLEGVSLEGMDITVRLAPHLPTVTGRSPDAGRLRVSLPLLGDQQVANVALAAAVALAVGAPVEAVPRGLATLEPIRRRMQVLRTHAPAVLDDTSGNPDTIRALFRTVRHLGRTGVRALYGIRGTRGPIINQANAEALAAEATALGVRPLVVTASDDVADERNRVTREEREAVCATLRDAGVDFAFEAELAVALARVLEGVGEDDLVLLIGAQGMDRAAELLAAQLGDAARAEVP